MRPVRVPGRVGHPSAGHRRREGVEHTHTLTAAFNYANTLTELDRSLEEAKSVLRKMMPAARRILGDGNRLTLKMRSLYSRALYTDDGATLDDLREAVTTLEETARTARRVLGSRNPLTPVIEHDLRKSRAALRARETPSPGGSAYEHTKPHLRRRT